MDHNLQPQENPLKDFGLILTPVNTEQNVKRSQIEGFAPSAVAAGTSVDVEAISDIQIKAFLDQNFPPEADVPIPEVGVAISKQPDLRNESKEEFKQPKVPKRKITISYAEKYPPKKKSNIAEATSVPVELKSESEQTESVNIYTADQTPQWYFIHPNAPNVSKTVIPSKLPEAFEKLPIYGQPNSKAELKTFWQNKIRDFVGNGLTDDQFSNLEQYCSPSHFLTGKELNLGSNLPEVGILQKEIIHKTSNISKTDKLNVVKKYLMRKDNDATEMFVRRLKYRGIRLMPLSLECAVPDDGPSLIPGKDVIYQFRIYRPFSYQKQKFYRGRHSVFCRDLVMTGRQKLTALRDSFMCVNDLDMRIDMSERGTDLPFACARDVFPSGFLFINNVFYADTRKGCKDISSRIREWAKTKPDLGDFPCKDLSEVTLGELPLRLGHPEVFVHQGNCEHLFTVSQIRLVGPEDPLPLSHYPCHTAVSHNQTVYCTTCAEFGAKYVVTGCNRVPFNPGFFCDTCFKNYLYKDGKKVCDFKAYTYRNNEMHLMKQQG